MEKQPPSPLLHGWLTAEDNLQVLAVEPPRLSQGHDALFVAGELLDVHFLEDREGEGKRLRGQPHLHGPAVHSARTFPLSHLSAGSLEAHKAWALGVRKPWMKNTLPFT